MAFPSQVSLQLDEAGGFSAWSPDLLGCVAAAATYEECVALMRDAIVGHLEVMREHGDPITVPSSINAFTVVAA
jgi:predicted RNase H-like HicB family nuclease